ncbi:MAG: coproporphyrinogen dehydrogenase HemZ [Christensenellales bacterium]|jgi:coproporphyrinogen dehydrogenase HemZ
MIALSTEMPQFHNDIGDILRIFYPMHKLVDEKERFPKVEHRLAVDGGAMRHEAVFYPKDGISFAYALEMPRILGGALEQKKQHKRYAKVAVYRCMQQYFKKELPWGSLTGVRPTKLARELSLELGEAAAERLFAQLFDVGADRIALLFDIVQRQRPFLDSLLPEDIDLYIGIPFCPTRCLYCSFTSFPIGKKRRDVQPYLDTLLYEIDGAAELIAEYGYKPRCIYIGGGTPTSLLPDELSKLLRRLGDVFPTLSQNEFTVEAGRPDTLDSEKLRVLMDGGVNRISINPQTMNDATLARIGRRHGSEEIQKAFHTARALGFSHINMDIILGLPGEGAQDVAHTLDRLADLSPDSITVHTLAVKRASRLKEQGKMETASPGDMRKMLELSRDRAAAMSMHPYYMYRQKNMMGHLENTAYCLPGKECVYNIDMMEEAAHVLALGAGSISKRIHGGENRIERQANPKDLAYYHQRIEDCLQKKRALLRR